MRMKKIFSAVLALTVICGGTAPFAAEMPGISLTANAADETPQKITEGFLIFELYADYAKLIACKAAAEGVITIPSKINGLPVTEIGNGYNRHIVPFYECNNIKQVIIPDSVTNIEERAFSNSGIESISLPNSLKTIKSNMFWKCKNLKTISIPNSVTNIEDSAFQGCTNLSSIEIPDSVTDIGRLAFAQSGLESIDISKSINKIEKTTFLGCPNLSSITIPDSVTFIGDGAFAECESLSSIVIPDSVTIIEEGAFEACESLSSVTIPDSITSISDAAFWYCSSLESVTIPDSVTNIGREAFRGCDSLASITIPDSVTSIGELAFYGCSSFESITILNSKCEIFNEGLTIANGVDEIYNPIYNGVIKGYDNSTAQAYAEKYNYKFESLGAAPANTATESGDLNDDGKIDANDATLVLVNYSLLSTGEKIQLTESQQKAADVNGDGKIDSSDATTILQYYSYLSTGGKDSFADFMASQK